MPRITIVGAGLSGMVAAINLARQDYEVTILEKEKQIGGSSAFHPSLHATPIDVRYTSEFTGIDLYEQFPLLSDIHSCIKDTRIISTDLITYGVERGARETSLDVYLHRLCRELGVKFEFGQTVKKLTDVPPGSIIATGLMSTLDDLESKQTIKVYGHSFVIDSKIGPSMWVFMDKYSPDYFYAVGMNGILYGLLFARQTKVDKKWIEVVEKQFYDRAGITLKAEWKPFYCEVVMDNRLFAGPGNKYILTGTASGTYDPYYGFGIVGALTSGKISSLAVRDPEGAQIMFNRINRNHDYLFRLFETLERLPISLKLKLFKTIPSYYKFLKPLLRRMGHGIPGYPGNWVEDANKSSVEKIVEDRQYLSPV